MLGIVERIEICLSRGWGGRVKLRGISGQALGGTGLEMRQDGVRAGWKGRHGCGLLLTVTRELRARRSGSCPSTRRRNGTERLSNDPTTERG